MSNGIHRVRKSIQQRKKKRIIRPTGQTNQSEQLIELPTDEEKHGFLPNIIGAPSVSKKGPLRMPVMLMKAMISVSLFFVIAIIMQSNHASLNSVKGWTSQALTDDFPFATVRAWYSDTFGSPLGLEPRLPAAHEDEETYELPVRGNVTEAFQANGRGIYITPEQSGPIYAWEDGIVVFVGKKQDTDTTIVVQHVDGGKTTYGNMSSTDVHLYQSVKKSEQLGTFDQEDASQTVFFSLEQDRLFIDPIQVIQVDDQ